MLSYIPDIDSRRADRYPTDIVHVTMHACELTNTNPKGMFIL